MCIVDGCTEPESVCPFHWFMLPASLHGCWWGETDYSAKPPSPELIARANAAIRELAANPVEWEKRRISRSEHTIPACIKRSKEEAGGPQTEQGNGDDDLNPTYYARWPVPPIEYIARNNLPFWQANIIKYIARFDRKNGLQDLRKARWYLNLKIREMGGKEDFWKGGSA
jgi:hypothetical protein